MNLNIIDLISEKHIELRKELRKNWLELGFEEVSNTESLLLVKLNQKNYSLAEIARHANVSRQAMFKCAKKLSDKGYLAYSIDENGIKSLILTQKGIDYCRNIELLKKELQERIKSSLGKNNFDNLINLLNETHL